MGEGLNEAGAEGEDGDDEEIGDQGPLAAISIRDETEDDLGKEVRAVKGEREGATVLRHRRNGRGG